MCCFGGCVILGGLLALGGFALALGGFALSKGWVDQALGLLTCNVMSNETRVVINKGLCNVQGPST